MHRLAFLVLLVVTVAACGGAASSQAPAPSAAASTRASAGPTAAATPVPTAAPLTAAPSQAFKAGGWPPEWQFWICSARAQMLRKDAEAGGHLGEDAATQAIADLKKTQINWEPGADFRAFLGKSAFILLDAAPRPGNAMADVPPAIATFQKAYEDLKAATGFECPS